MRFFMYLMASLFCDPITGNVHNTACELTRGGLIKTIYAANLSEIDTITLVAKEVTAITMKINPVTAQPFFWFQIVPKKNSAGMANIAQIGNNKFYNQQLTFAIQGFSTQNKNSFESMIVGEAVFIGEDANGNKHILGHVSGAEMTEGDLGVGIAVDDLVGGNAIFVAQETFVTPSVVPGTAITVLSADGITTENIVL